MKLIVEQCPNTKSFTPTNEISWECCRHAIALEETGDYENACQAMGVFWTSDLKPFLLTNLDQTTRAAVLLRIGTLTGWMGSTRQIEGSQEKAKDLISQSIAILEQLQDPVRTGEAQMELAYCYWRQGAFDEARILLKEALSRLPDSETRLKATTYLRAALVESSSNRFYESLSILKAAESLFRNASHLLQGKFHNTRGLVLRNLGEAESRHELIDRALIEYTAASFHFEQAGHIGYCARVENNMGYLCFNVGNFTEAQRHFSRARELFLEVEDIGSCAQVDDSRAQMLLAQGQPADAERVVRGAVKALAKGGEQSLLAATLIIHGISLARSGKERRSMTTLQQAIQVAERSGDLETAGRARLSLLEELGCRLSGFESAGIYLEAVDLLQSSRDTRIKQRLVLSASIIVRSLSTQAPQTNGEAGSSIDSWHGFSLKDEIHRHERRLIEQALQDSGGYVSRAAQLLGFKHHQSLISLINHRHQSLANVRSTVRPRKRSILSHRSERDGISVTVRRMIISVEERSLGMDQLQKSFALKGWTLEVCPDPRATLRKLGGDKRYDLLILENDLSGVSGVEVVRRIRKMPHRRRTLIVMLSTVECETEAWRAGIDAFVDRDKDLRNLSSTILRLFNSAA